MPAVAPMQENFNGGEFSPLMLGRVTFDRYKHALKLCKNFIPLVQGPLTRRPGTYFCDEVKDSSKATRIVKFKYSTVSAFAIEFGDRYVRFKKNHAPIYDLTLTITGISQASPGVVTYTGTDPSNGEHVDLSGIVGMVELNGRRVVVTNVNAGANTFELVGLDGNAINTTTYTAYSSGGSAKRVYTLTTTYVEADLFQLKFKQSADVLFIWHPDYPERQLTRTTDSSWTIADTTFLDGPYLAQNRTTPNGALSAITLTPGAATGSTTLTASASLWVSTDVGRLVRVKEGSTWGWARITGYSSATVVNIDIISTFTNTNAKATWRLGLYSATTGYPACGTFYGDRLYRGGCPAIPERLDGSNVGDYPNMAPSATDGTVTDSHAVSFRLNSDDVQTIRWMIGTSNGIAIGTYEGEWIVTPSNLNEAITPTNINAKQSTPWGSADVQACKVESAIIFVEAGGRRVREMNYLAYENTLQSLDATVLAEHITKNYDPSNPDWQASNEALSGLVEIDYAKKKVPIVWGVRKDGVLVSMVYSKDDKVLGWQRHLLGGWSNALHTNPPVVESCCVIPSPDGAYDELWLIVQRYIGGRVVRYTEFLSKLWEQGDNQTDSPHLDCRLTYDGAATQTLTGLHHLAGETVAVLADGGQVPDDSVQNTGVMNLDAEASVVQVGYPFDSDGQTLRFEAGSATGTAQGKKQRMHRVIFRLYDTLGLSIGPSFEHLTALPFRSASTPMGTPQPLFTGDRDIEWEGDYDTEATICWRMNSPLPGTVVALMPQMVTQDRT